MTTAKLGHVATTAGTFVIPRTPSMIQVVKIVDDALIKLTKLGDSK